GKTRLLMELASAARSPTLQVLTGECAAPLSSEGRQPGGDPLHAFRGVLLAVADRCRERGGAETERILGRRGAVLALYQPAILDVPGVRELPPPPQLPPDAARQRLFTYFADTLRELAAEAPIVLVVDDLQWADDLTLGLFAHLGQGDLLSGMGVLVVGAYRTEEAPQGLPSLAAAAHHLSLGRLKDDAIVAIVSEMLAMTPPPDALVRKLARHAEGNPFFVAEYLRTALGEGLLTRDRRGRWQVAGSPDRPGATGALSIPGSLRDLVRRRVQGLSPEARAVLEVGAILGREIDEGLLAAVAGIGDADVIEEIGVLLARQVLEEVEPGRCRFVHDQIRQITADEIATARRRELHRAAAQEMTTRFAADLDPHLAQVGFHWEQAGVKARAQECYLRAGVWSDTRHDYRERERLLRACLALDTEITPAGVGARVDLGDFLIQIYGRTAEARAEQQRALEEARAIGDRATELRALMGLATASRVTGALEEARVLYEQCVTAAHEAGNGTVETSLIGHLAIVHHELGHMEEARDLYEKAIALSSASGQRHTQAINLVNLANLHREQGRVQEALEGYAKALEMHRAARQQRLEAAALVNLGELCLDLGRLDAARNLAEQALEIYREVLNRRAEAYTMNILVTYHRLNGRFTEALRINELVSAAAREIRDRHLLGTSLRELGTIELERGNFASARNALEEAVAIHREARDPRSELYALVPLVAVRRRLGQRAGLDEIVGDALERASSLDQKSSIAAALCEQGHLAIAGGEPARKPLDRAREIARGVGYEPSSELGQAIAALEAAERAREVGGPLLAGEAVERLPPDVQRAIIAAAGRT
ncbi:MAG: tetratricopeptide repeat protein, partial [Acidobacteriota bacterium]